MRLCRASLIIICVTLFLCENIFAQQAPAQDPSSQAKATPGKKKTAINFDDQLVSGELRKPELFYLLQKKQFNFGRLIKLRENFLPEMRKTAEEIQRGSN